ncbi:hypothetical protein PoB_002496400 [Plakobranchus ocellatus]|uniref:Uncharacterized protein n=1 Tax=Plakobranchus ocellatus TaxID=259542 RepID=A0AAV3ZSY8_9GAST|nr:hypothetical protein PoB_002496400 [Plakobranchus ocellatus]
MYGQELVLMEGRYIDGIGPRFCRPDAPYADVNPSALTSQPTTDNCPFQATQNQHLEDMSRMSWILGLSDSLLTHSSES